MVNTHVLGFPRIGAQRELKFALEACWKAAGSEAKAEQTQALLDTGKRLRQRHWQMQRDAGLSWVTVGDFAWYDNMLSLCATLGALPARFGFDPAQLSLAQYFELARGNAEQPAMADEGEGLGGGYGRGEGGVLRSPESGEDQPYNDLEFYVFTRGSALIAERRFRRARRPDLAAIDQFEQFVSIIFSNVQMFHLSFFHNLNHAAVKRLNLIHVDNK